MTAPDLESGSGWNFVFGQASLEARVGVWSLARFGDLSASGDEGRRSLLRTLKVATHESGPMVSMAPCRAYACGMAGSNNLAPADRAPLWLCPECVAKRWHATGVDPAGRYTALAGHGRSWGLEPEAAFYEASAAALRTPC